MWLFLAGISPPLVWASVFRSRTDMHPHLSVPARTFPQDESLLDALERLRGRFKAVASGLGCLQVGHWHRPTGTACQRSTIHILMLPTLGP